MNLWGDTPPAGANWRPQRADDGVIEVVGFTGLAHLLSIKSGMARPVPLAQVITVYSTSIIGGCFMNCQSSPKCLICFGFCWLSISVLYFLWFVHNFILRNSDTL